LLGSLTEAFTGESDSDISLFTEEFEGFLPTGEAALEAFNNFLGSFISGILSFASYEPKN